MSIQKLGFLVFSCKNFNDSCICKTIEINENNKNNIELNSNASYDLFSRESILYKLKEIDLLDNRIFKEEIYANLLAYEIFEENKKITKNSNNNFINENIKIYRFFTETIFEQNIIVVPLDSTSLIDNDKEIKENYIDILEHLAKDKLLSLKKDDEEKISFEKVSSLIFLKEDDKDFNDTNYLIRTITSFLVGINNNISPNGFKEFNNLNYIIDGSGIGVYFKNKPLTIYNINKVIQLLVMCKSYLLSFDKAIKLMINVIDKVNHDRLEVNNILLQINKFFICNYFDNPIKISKNETYYLYSYIKERFKLTELLKEILIKLENLKNIYHLI